MKRTRKGFTLVELLIVIAILGALAATMSTSSGNATARAKAAAIVANVEACKAAAALFYADNWDVDTLTEGPESGTKMSATTAAAFLGKTKDSAWTASTYVANFKDFSTGSITFTVGTGVGRDNWNLVVSFADDAEATNIQKALVKAKGYSDVADGKTGFTVNLTTGAISNITPTA